MHIADLNAGNLGANGMLVVVWELLYTQQMKKRLLRLSSASLVVQ